MGFDSQAPAGLNRSFPAATTAIHRSAARHFRPRAQSWRNPPYSRRRGPRRSRRWPATGARGGEVSADRVGRRRRLVAESDRSAHLDGIDEHFPAGHRGRKYSADERKPELRVLCSVSGVETRGVRESGPSREGLLLEAAGQGCLTLRAWSSGAWSFRRQTWRSRRIHLLQISSSEVG